MRKSLTLFVYATKARRATCFNHPQMSDLHSAHNRAAITKRIWFSVNTFNSDIIQMNQQATASQRSRAEQETENEANRLREQVDAALAAAISRSPDEVESLQTAADRIERAARDLADAVRELARQRKSPEIL
jgi:disulfide oxidoreductase YuzD